MSSIIGKSKAFLKLLPAVKLLIISVFAGAFVVSSLQPIEERVHSQAVANTATSLPSSTDVGKDCKQCHAAVVDAFVLETHGKSAKFLGDSRAASCQVCHTNSVEHAKNSSRTKSGADPGNPAKLSASAINQSCLQCHSQDRHTFAWQGGKHDRKDVSCLSCHSQHHAKSEENLLTGFTTEETCLRCHTSVRKAVYQRSSHLIRTERGNMKVGCTSCHNPHGGESEKMLVEPTANNVCYTCHSEKRGPFLWDHPPVRENCMNCHSPHGSSNMKLLTQRANLQCQQCHIHMLPRHSTTAGKPLDIWTLNRGCVNCHSQVHGSNHPGGRTFTR
jgi:DmsE family decaheme c-type cytochrome